VDRTGHSDVACRGCRVCARCGRPGQPRRGDPMAVTARTLQAATRARHRAEQDHRRPHPSLVSAWADAWDEIAPDLTAALLEQLTAGDRVTSAQLLRSTGSARRWCDRRNLEELARSSGGADHRRPARRHRHRRRRAGQRDRLPAAADTDLVAIDAWSRVDAHQIAAIVRRSTSRSPPALPLCPQAYDAVRRELIRGVAQGPTRRSPPADGATRRGPVQRRPQPGPRDRPHRDPRRAPGRRRAGYEPARRRPPGLGVARHPRRAHLPLVLVPARQHPPPRRPRPPNDHQQGRCAGTR
jgi:hypothetical protein